MFYVNFLKCNQSIIDVITLFIHTRSALFAVVDEIFLRFCLIVFIRSQFINYIIKCRAATFEKFSLFFLEFMWKFKQCKLIIF